MLRRPFRNCLLFKQFISSAVFSFFLWWNALTQFAWLVRHISNNLNHFELVQYLIHPESLHFRPFSSRWNIVYSFRKWASYKKPCPARPGSESKIRTVPGPKHGLDFGRRSCFALGPELPEYQTQAWFRISGGSLKVVNEEKTALSAGDDWSVPLQQEMKSRFGDPLFRFWSTASSRPLAKEFRVRTTRTERRTIH